MEWLADIIEDPRVISELGLPPGAGRRLLSTASAIYARTLCLRCKGKGLCGRQDCPFLQALRLYASHMPELEGREVEGRSPPAVFVGRMGYPYVSVGPLIPPLEADTSFFDKPEGWFGLPLDEIVRMRASLVRGKFVVNVRKPWKAGKLMEQTLELALSDRSVEAEAELASRPRRVVVLDEGVQPFGPSAPLRALDVDVGRWDHRLERAYSDTDLRARDAVLWLYERGVPVSRIQRAFSVGALGLGKLRRLVPTRWSITAVDSIISISLAERIKRYPIIGDYRVYTSAYLDNRYAILLMPEAWSFELIEAWAPGAVWNPQARIAVVSDWEGPKGRWTYARPGGSYYAARLAVTEALERMRRQARAVVFREIHPGYTIPVGVWQVRESLRAALRSEPRKASDLHGALQVVARWLEVPMRIWLRASRLLRDALEQKRLTDFLAS